MKIQVFGCVSSPTICNYALILGAQDGANEFAEAADRFQTNFYVDNYLDSRRKPSDSPARSRRY